jgi:endonuclease/exonuclease/phosphatase family metal-dependent hydrolase
MRRRALLIVSPLLGAALIAPAQIASATAASAAPTAAHHASGERLAAGTHSDARKKKKKKKPKKKHVVVLHLPAKPLVAGSALTNAVRVSWGTTHNATRYRVKWSFAPWDLWPSASRYSGWLPVSARSLTRVMSTDAAHDSTMTALPYANPVFARVQAANRTRLGFLSQWQAVWPQIPRPAAGDDVRFGTYNVMLAGQSNWATRMPVIAQNIASRGLTVVALQETLNTDGSDVAAELTRLTGHSWQTAPSDRTEGRILYDSSRFTLLGSGSLSDYSPYDQKVVSYRTGDEIRLPWARLTAVGSNRSFVVVSVHFAPADASLAANAQGNRETGASARAVLAAMNNLAAPSEPAVIAGDFAGGYGLWGDQNPAQPTLVRAGWWDSMASLSRAGINYSTVNGQKAQVAATTLGGRADGIFLRGIHGSLQYQNVANYFLPGTHTPPSDHNLVFSEFQVPN